MKTSKKSKPKAEGGFRTVVLTNGTEYVTHFNTTFGIISLGSRSEACEMFLKDAVDVIKDINSFGVHKLYAELI